MCCVTTVAIPWPDRPTLYNDWLIRHGYLMLAAKATVGEFLKTFKEFPPRQKAASVTIDQAMEKMESVDSGALR